MAAVKNNKANVSAAKGVAGGYVFRAAAGTALPTDYSTALAEAYKNIGFVGEDGITFTPTFDVTEHKDMNGDVIDKSLDGADLEIAMTLVEVKAATLKAQYGEDNVTDAGGVLTVMDRLQLGEHCVLVFDLLLKNGRKMRRVCPDCEPTELGEETVGAGDLFARESKWAAYKDDETGCAKIDYIESTETEA